MKMVKCSVPGCRTICNVNDEITKPICEKCFKKMIGGGAKK